MKQIMILCMVFICCCSELKSQTQQVIQLKFIPTLASKPIVQNEVYKIGTTEDELSFETIKFYISSVQFLQNEKIVFEEKESYHLLDLLEIGKDTLNLTLPENIAYNQLKFQLGIDSATNSSGAMGGDLDPTKGMYWTWQNGYINFKLEGTATKSKARNHSFEFHLGGYTTPFASIQQITLNCEKNNKQTIQVALDKFLQDIDFSTFDHLMLPGEEAVKLSEKAKTMYSIQR